MSACFIGMTPQPMRRADCQAAALRLPLASRSRNTLGVIDSGCAADRGSRGTRHVYVLMMRTALVGGWNASSRARSYLARCLLRVRSPDSALFGWALSTRFPNRPFRAPSPISGTTSASWAGSKARTSSSNVAQRTAKSSGSHDHARSDRAQLDLLVTSGTPAATAAKNATSTVPIVVIGMGDPVGHRARGEPRQAGWQPHRPFHAVGSELVGKWFELLHEAIPRLVSIAVISNPESSMVRRPTKEFRGIAADRGVKLRFDDVRESAALARAVKQAAQKAQAALVISDPVTATARKQIARACRRTSTAGTIRGI